MEHQTVQTHNIYGKRYEVLKKAFNFTLNSSLQPFSDENLIETLFGDTFNNIDDVKVIMEKFKDVCKNSISVCLNLNSSIYYFDFNIFLE